MRSFFIFCGALFLGSSFSFSGDFDLLTHYLTGSFDSSGQAAEDSDYHNIHLNMVRIWPERNDGYWLYVEQAVSTNLDQPYRQRVYQVREEGEGVFVSRIFTIENDKSFAGAWRDEDLLKTLTFEHIALKEGCDVFLKREGDSFVGSTREGECKSPFRGATYTMSEIVLTESELRSWDRGFDEHGEQVWGAEKGAYIFVRK